MNRSASPALPASPVPSAAAPTRCLAVWLASGAVAAALGALLVPDLAAGTQAVADGSWRLASFERLLVWTASAVAALVLVWLWTVTGLVALGAARGRRRPSAPGCPDVLRRLVLAACGIAVGTSLLGGPALAATLPAPVPVGGSADPVQARGDLADGGGPAVRRDARPDLDGLPMPDRAPSAPSAPSIPSTPDAGQVPVPPSRPTGTVVVGPGDSLWDLAAADLARRGRVATDAQVDRRWREVHRLNRAVVGDDPDLIVPGQRLRLPGTTQQSPQQSPEK